LYLILVHKYVVKELRLLNIKRYSINKHLTVQLYLASISRQMGSLVNCVYINIAIVKKAHKENWKTADIMWVHVWVGL